MIFNRILPFAAILVALGLIFLYIRPTFAGSIADTKTHIQSYDAALAAADRFKEKQAELTTASKNISGSALDRLNSFLPDGVDNIQLILDLNGLAARSGMVLSNFNVGTPPVTNGSSTPGTPGSAGVDAGTTVDSLDITVTASGTYQSFRVFLNAIESSLRPLDIQSITIQQTPTGTYTYDIGVRIYWLHS